MKTIAIIDDDKIFQFTTQIRLKKLESIKDILSFEDGEQAYDYLKLGENLPDIIFLDINMPIVDGWDFLELFKELPEAYKENITIYMTSSSINPDDVKRADENKYVNKYVVKPFENEVLEEIFN